MAKRAKTGAKRSSGYSAALGSYLGYLGAQTLVISQGMWLYLRTAAQGADVLDLDAFAEEARRLAALFTVADAWLAERWQD